MKIVYVLNNGVKISKAHALDGAYDLSSTKAMTIPAFSPDDNAENNWAIVPTGLFMAMPAGLSAHVIPRSGLAAKHGITVLNSPGLIDSGYRDEVGAILINYSKKDFEIAECDRIAQLEFQCEEEVELVFVDELPATTDERNGGFGSSGIKQK